MEKLMSCKATVAISAIWFVVFALSKVTAIDTVLSGKGMNVIGNEYWRFLTAGFVQTNLIHTLGNWYALAGYILMQQLLTPGFPVVGRKWMLIYALVFLPVVPIIPGMNVGTAVFHGIAFAAGVVMGFFRLG